MLLSTGIRWPTSAFLWNNVNLKISQEKFLTSSLHSILELPTFSPSPSSSSHNNFDSLSSDDSKTVHFFVGSPSHISSLLGLLCERFTQSDRRSKPDTDDSQPSFKSRRIEVGRWNTILAIGGVLRCPSALEAYNRIGQEVLEENFPPRGQRSDSTLFGSVHCGTRLYGHWWRRRRRG